MLGHDHHIIWYDVKDKKELFIHAAIRYFGVWMIGIFLPALLFKTYGLPLYIVFGFFGLTSAFIVPLNLLISGKLVSRYWSKVSMTIWIIMLICFLLCFFWLGSWFNPTLLVLTAFFLWAFTAFFWMWYHYDMSGYAKSSHFGWKVANLNIIITISSSLAPLLAGLIIDNVGVEANLTIAIIIVAFSLFPLRHSYQRHKQQTFKVKQIADMLHESAGIHSFITFGALSYYKAVSMIIRPLVIFLFVWNYTKLWIISTATAILTVTFIFIVGKYMDRNQDKKAVKTALFFESINRLTASLTLALSLFSNIVIIWLDIVHRLSSKSTEAILSKKLYVYAHDNKINPVYMIIIHEVSHHIVKAIAMFWRAIVFFFFPYNRLLIAPIMLMLIAIPLQYSLFRNKKEIKHPLTNTL